MKNFYWIKTYDNHENWFVVAYDEYLAGKFFEDTEGYDMELFDTTEICEVIFEDNEEDEYYPSNEMLTKNGFEIIKAEMPMIVWKNGKKYCHGDIISSVITEINNNKLGLYIIYTGESPNLYKIGITKNITQRIKQFETGNPFEFKLFDFFVTESCRELESIVHKKLEKNKYRKEWFLLNIEELKDIGNFARDFIGLPNYINEINMLYNNNLTKQEIAENNITENDIIDLPF